MTISIIAACDHNGLIGNSKTNDMPWGRSIPEDLKFFREQTLNNVVVYGRKTFESIGSQPLPNRTNIILTHHHFNIHSERPNSPAFTIASVKEVLRYHEQNDRHMYICGGFEVYKSFLPYANDIILTHVDGEFEGDVYFPLKDFHLDLCCRSEIIKEIPVSESNPHHLTMKKYFYDPPVRVHMK